jgi:hypothetical protein
MDTQSQIQSIVTDFAYDEINNKITDAADHYYCMLSYLTHNDNDQTNY